jgi:hypothetical protein
MSHPTANAHLAYITHGDREYSAVFVPRCHTCRSAHRVEIEGLLIDGLPPRTIVERLPKNCGVSAQSVRRHYARGHLPIDAQAVRDRQQIRAEQRWSELGLSATTWQAEQADIAQHVLETCTRLLLNGELKLSVATLMRATRFIYGIETAAHQKEEHEQVVQRLVQQSIEEMQRIFEIAGEIGGEQIKHELIRKACVDTVTEAILLDDRFAELRAAAYLEAESSQEGIRPTISQLSTPRLRHSRSDRAAKVAA